MKYIVTTLLLLSLAGASYAQPTFTATQFLQLLANGGISGGDNYSSTSSAGLQELINISGPNQSWNFNAVTFGKDASSTVNFKEVSGFEPLATSFPMATHVEISTDANITSYDYYMINDTGMFMLGSADDTTGGGKGITAVNNPPMQFIKFPLTYQTAWTTTMTIPSVGAVDVVNVVDSWGSLVLPGNGSVTSLRIKRTYAAGPISFSQYQWVGENGNEAMISMTPFSEPSATYHIPTGSSAVQVIVADKAITIANPLSSSAQLSVALPVSGETSVSVSDILGRTCLSLYKGFASSGALSIPLNVTSLTNGTYFLNIESAGLKATRKITVAH